MPILKLIQKIIKHQICDLNNYFTNCHQYSNLNRVLAYLAKNENYNIHHSHGDYQHLSTAIPHIQSHRQTSPPSAALLWQIL